MMETSDVKFVHVPGVLKDVSTRKHLLETEVLRLIQDFQKNTGAVVTDIRLEMINFSEGGRRHIDQGGVQLTVEVV